MSASLSGEEEGIDLLALIDDLDRDLFEMDWPQNDKDCLKNKPSDEKIVTPSGNQPSKCNISEIKSKVESVSKVSKHKKSFQLFVGGLGWWTNDKKLQDVLKDIGVNDIIAIRFNENKNSGQSNGYVAITVQSHSSIKLMRDKLFLKPIDGCIPFIANQRMTGPIEQSELLSMDNPRPPQPVSGPRSQMGMNPGPARMMMPFPGPRGPRMFPRMSHDMGQRMFMEPRMSRGFGPRNICPLSSPPSGFNAPPRPPMRFQNNCPPCFPRPPMYEDQYCQKPAPMTMGPGGIPPTRCMTNGPAMNPWAPYSRNDWSGHPSPMGQQSVTCSSRPDTPMPHLNLAFLSSPSCPPPPPFRQNPVPAVRGNESHNATRSMTEAEIQEVMSRNMTVSSSAISRAVADATLGDFESAIEILDTAIGLIRHSTVWEDSRCKVLVSSLDDALLGIESKYYERRNDYRLSGERDRYGGRSTRRNRSRSREYDVEERSREYRVRSRSRSRERYSRDYTPDERDDRRSSSRYYDERRSYYVSARSSRVEENENSKDPEVHRATHR